MPVLRWILLVPTALLAWYAVFAIGLFAHGYVEQDLCPPEDLISGFCGNAHIQTALRILEHGAVGFSAIAVETSAVSVVPSYKRQVAWVTLAIGLLAAVYLAASADTWSFFGAAAAGGVLAVLTLERLIPRPV